MSDQRRVAVLHQACEPPVVNGVRKPQKPGGYQDSGADIAYVLQSKNIKVVTPKREPSPSRDQGWTFPDTEDGVLEAIRKGATTLWANTILFADHPLQKSTLLDKFSDAVKMVGQPPKLVEQYDDKNYVNDLFRAEGSFTMPRCWVINSSQPSQVDLSTLPFPVVAKPIRGRGSHGVKLCKTEAELSHHVSRLFEESPIVMVEEYLSGQEGTITVMPPSDEHPEYWSMPIVVRFNHEHGIAPYNGVVAVTANSRLLSPEELSCDSNYARISEECERIARLLQVTAPIRVDVRRFKDSSESAFAAFDINMKPVGPSELLLRSLTAVKNMTGPGRPGRENQASLTAIGAAGLEWDYPTLLTEILSLAKPLSDLRKISIAEEEVK
ncbi:hypothetical protein LTR84_007657 [Exophiala bonariae]|uniref:ATP-grasp domain-containing protein n=1 Tax=Exophiala bonariae TaxID=1690606 RepID=A0AAV9NPI6_9EURO|nr:hypothetical protein LTR84_007657 [Exophiala bonariae]